MVDLLVREDSPIAAPADAVREQTDRPHQPDGPDLPDQPGQSDQPDPSGQSTSPRPIAAQGFEWPRTARRLRSAFRGHPYRQDVVLALTVLLLTLLPSQAGKPSELLHAPALLLVTSIVQSSALIWRRPAPVTTFGLVLVACTVEWAAALSSSSDISLMICLYTIARYRSLMALRVALGAIVPSLVVLVVRMAPVQGPVLISLFFLGAAVAASAALGLMARERQVQLAALAERAITAEQQREQRARLAVLAERARFSRETHDIVGHSLAVIIGLADGGARQVEARPERGRQVFELIAETSRQSLADLRETLGALREHGPGEIGADAFAPQPGVADISELLERTRSAGPQVSFRSTGETAALPRSLQSAVYRIVQESLTNVLKHAGPDTSVRVVIEADAQSVRMSVTDSGPAQAGLGTGLGAGPAGGFGLGIGAGFRRSLRIRPNAGGQGLAGVRERAALAGGRAEAGPNEAGGWTVAAQFPLASAQGA